MSTPPPNEGIESVGFSAKEMVQVLQWLCNGARQEKGIHFNCHVFDADGQSRDLQLVAPATDVLLDPFCKEAAGLQVANQKCREWHRDVCCLCRRSGERFKPQVMQCPFGFSLLVAPVSVRKRVRAVLFAGNWREVGAEGLMYQRLQEAQLPCDEARRLEATLTNSNDGNVGSFLLHERADELKGTLREVADHVGRFVHLIYLREQTVREHALVSAITKGLANLGIEGLHQACRGLGGLLEEIRNALGIEYIVMFTNTGLHSRLEACAGAGMQVSWEGHYLKGTPESLVAKVREEGQLPGHMADWLEALLRVEQDKSASSQLRRAQYILPIQLGSFCGLLVLGPDKHSAVPPESTMDSDDRLRLRETARHALMDGLRDMAERRELAEMLSKFAHLLRGPLMPLQGAVGALREKVEANALDRDSLVEICDDVESAISDLTRQADDFEQAKLSGLMEYPDPQFQVAPIITLVDKVWQGLAAWASKRGIQARGFPSLRSLLDVEMDWDQMKVVFANLLHNAVNYSHNNCTIELAGEQFDRDGESWIRVAITDFGTGIHPREIAKRIYEPRFRGSVRDSKRHIEGTGMGLAICAQIIRRHHGQLHATCVEQDSTPKEYQHCWVTFFVELPLRQNSKHTTAI